MSASKIISSKLAAAIADISIADQAADKSAALHLPELQKAMAGWSVEEVRDAVQAPYAQARGITLSVKSTGRVCWPDIKNNKEANAARSGCERLIARIMGDVVKQTKDDLEVPAHIAKLAAALAKACNEYEEAKRLASTAVAAAFAAK